MKQNGIRNILKRNKIIPVATISSVEDVPTVVQKLQSMNISCIEVTLRTEAAFDVIEILKKEYNDVLDVGVGTLVSKEQLDKMEQLEVDFIVSPGLPFHLLDQLESSNIPFLPGVVTPTEVIQGMNKGYDTFKLFPADIVGGSKLLKTYASIFPNVKFCPTGGINGENYPAFLDLPNVISVGGSWVMK